MKSTLAVALVVVLCGTSAAVPPPLEQPIASGQPDVARSATGMIVADEPIAAQAGLEILSRGGNAIDAAVAVAFALAVTHPQAGNLGGGGFMLIRKANGETVFIDYREVAPRAARADMYLDAEGNRLPGASTEGWRAAAVPGTVAGLEFALKNYGTQPWEKVMQPAIRLADKGFPVSPQLADDLIDSAPKLSRFEESRKIFLRGGKFYAPGDTFKQKDLADTLKKIAKGGAREFYQGSIAAQLAAEMKRNGGLITAADLRAYQVKKRAPLVGRFRGYEVITAPPPSSGGVALLEMLNILDPLLPADARANDPATIHIVVESMRRAFADRARYLADADFACVPVETLTAAHYADEVRASINRERASASAKLEMPSVTSCKPSSQVAGREGSNTTHFAVIDSEGNAVANTYTINEYFGSGVTVPGLGFLLNDEMDDFTTRPGAPNVLFNLVQSDANQIEPGKRPLSSMTPTIVTRDGQTVLVLGSPGGARIINSVFLVLLNRLAFGLSLPEAVALPRYHHQWMPDVLFLEKDSFTSAQMDALRSRGHEVRDISEISSSGSGPKHVGQVNAIERDPKTGDLIGVGDARRGGIARTY
ncbi:MAG TPA: gamma-glutamyltransferase [Candidatus Xenobia bacterium]|nr:gamma-glutamyltransferase [Candidatus Xenobia bacterium]